MAPLASGQVDDIRGEVDDIEASGYTPMGPALRQAADELPDEGARNVVLVSDGLDTCAPPPVCDVAKELHEQGIDLIINTVGFLVDDEARTELECIAEAGAGDTWMLMTPIAWPNLCVFCTRAQLMPMRLT